MQRDKQIYSHINTELITLAETPIRRPRSTHTTVSIFESFREIFLTISITVARLDASSFIDIHTQILLTITCIPTMSYIFNYSYTNIFINTIVYMPQ